MCIWRGFHLHDNTAKHGYSGVVKESTGEWNGALLSSVMRVGSVCMRVMHVHVYGVDLVIVIFQGIFAHDTQAHLRLHGVGAIHYNSRSHLVFLQGKVNSARYIAQVVNPVPLSFLRLEDNVIFSRTTHIHILLLRRYVLFALRDVQQLPWSGRTKISPQLNTCGT